MTIHCAIHSNGEKEHVILDLLAKPTLDDYIQLPDGRIAHVVAVVHGAADALGGARLGIACAPVTHSVKLPWIAEPAIA